jgi:hypothetical protein
MGISNRKGLGGGGGGADALGSYIVQTAANKPTNAQVLGALATGFAKVTTTTGVVSTVASIVGTDLSGFTATAIPIANGSGQLVDSTLRLASNVLTHGASSSGAAVGMTIANTSNSASSTARLTVQNGGASAGNAGISLVGSATWSMDLDQQTNQRLIFSKASTIYMSLDPVSSFNEWKVSPTGEGNPSLSIGAYSASGDSRAGVHISGVTLAASNYVNHIPDTAGTAGKGIAFIAFNQTKWTNVLSYVNPASGQPVLQLVENGGTITSASTATTFTSANAAATNSLSVINSDNTNTASHAQFLVQAGGASGGDPYTQWSVNGATNFVAGIDNSDSDYFKIHAGTALDTTTAGFRMSTSGNISYGIITPSANTGRFLFVRETLNSGRVEQVWQNVSGTGTAGIELTGSQSVIDLEAQPASGSNTFLASTLQATALRHSGGTGGLKVGTSNASDLILGTNNVERLRISSAGLVAVVDASDFAVGTTTGTKFGTATTQKLGFWNATPVVQPTGGAATAGGSYTATEQAMLQTLWNNARTLGLMS